MFDYTKSVFTKTVEDLKKLAFLFGAALQIFQIGYLIYALCIGSGILVANIVLLALSCAYLLFTIYINGYEVPKKIKRILINIYRWSKRLIKLFTLGVSVYGLFITASETVTIKSLVSIILLVFMLIAWIMDVLFSLLIAIIERRKNLFFDAIKMDFEPVLKAKNFFDKIRGKEVESEIVSTSQRSKLDAWRTERKEIQRLKKQEKKDAKAALKAAKKAEKNKDKNEA